MRMRFSFRPLCARMLCYEQVNAAARWYMAAGYNRDKLQLNQQFGMRALFSTVADRAYFQGLTARRCA